MNNTTQNGRKKRILRIALLSITALIMISGIAIWLIIQNYMSKINIDFGSKADTKAMEADVYFKISSDLKDWKSSVDATGDSSIMNTPEDLVIAEEVTEPIVSDSNSMLATGQDILEKEGAVATPDTEDNGLCANDILAKLNSYLDNNSSNQMKLMKDKDITNILFVVGDNIKEAELNNPIRIILLSINQDEEVISTISFSNSIYLEIQDDLNDSLSTAYLYGGAELLMGTLQNNFRIKIDRFIVTDNTSFQTLLATIGSEELNLDNINQVLNDILPCITTNLKENEILSFVLMMPTYMNYKQIDYSIPIENSYETFELGGIEFFGIDFEKNIKVLKDNLY